MRLNGEPDFMRSSTPLHHLSKYALLGLVGVCVVLFTGCISDRAGSALAGVMIGQAIAPMIGLSLSVSEFRQATQRWPTNYAEFSAFLQQSGDAVQLRQYDRIDFTENSDGSLEVYAVAPDLTNRMTLTAKDTDSK